MSKTALVTGGGIRLGRAIALHLAEQGFDIALHYNSSKEPAQKTSEEIEKLGRKCGLFQLDFSQNQDYHQFITTIEEQMSPLTLVVNSASLYSQTTIAETATQVFDSTFSTNFKAPFFITQAFAAVCKKGEIINIVDNKTGFNQFVYSIYLLSKKALEEFTRMSALEYAPEVRINGISPGVVLPASVRSKKYIDWRIQGIPVGIQGNVANILQAVDYLLKNNFVTGQTLVVDGGESLTSTGRNAAEYHESDQ